MYAPADKTLAARLARVREEAALHSGFFQSQGAHFTVLFEGPSDEELSRKILDVLEAAYWRVGTALLTFPERIIPVVLYTEEQFRDITRSPGWAAAAYDGRIRVPVRGALTNPEELDRVLTHEFTHALVQSIAPRGVPTWLNEGLAVTFEPNGPAWSDAQLGKLQLPDAAAASGWRASTSCRARRRAWPMRRAAAPCAHSSSKPALRRWSRCSRISVAGTTSTPRSNDGC